MNSTLFQTAYAELKALGLVLQQAPGEYRVNFRNGTVKTEHITDDLQAAVMRGREMAAHPPPRPDPPLGPIAPRSPRKALMFAHNRRDAARRRRKQLAEGKS